MGTELCCLCCFESSRHNGQTNCLTSHITYCRLLLSLLFKCAEILVAGIV